MSMDESQNVEWMKEAFLTNIEEMAEYIIPPTSSFPEWLSYGLSHIMT